MGHGCSLVTSHNIIIPIMLRALLRHQSSSFATKYSRFYLQDLAIDRQAIAREQRAAAQLRRQQEVLDMPANGRNPNNFVKLRMNAGIVGADPKPTYAREQCWVLEPKPIVDVPKVTISAQRKYIITSIKKAKDALMFLRKRHVLDAINRLERSHRKVAKVLVRTFYNLIDHAKCKGLNPTRLWVHGYVIGLTKRYKGLRYAARGRGYREKRDFCQVKIILWEKPQKDYFQEIAIGECAPGISNLVRFTLKAQRADYKTLAKFTGVTTAKGKQQARMLFKRRVDHIMLANKKEGKYQPRKIIAERVKAELGQAMKARFFSLQHEQYETRRIRERLYKKNMGL